MTRHRISLLGAGFIGRFYTAAVHGGHGGDRVHTVYSRTEAGARTLVDEFGLSRAMADLQDAVEDADTDVVVMGQPNDLHLEAVSLAAAAGKAVLCTKPSGRTAAETRQMLAVVTSAGVFAGYLEDLVYPPRTLKAIASVAAGALGQVLWVRSRQTHPGPHAAWFWDVERAGGDAMVDMGYHTDLYVQAFRSRERAAELGRFYAAFTPQSYLSSVVLHELLAGANTPVKTRQIDREITRPFERMLRLITSTHEDWETAADVLDRMVREEGFELRRTPKSLVNDVLPAASCRRTRVTRVRDYQGDFERIRRYLRFVFVLKSRAGDR